MIDEWWKASQAGPQVEPRVTEIREQQWDFFEDSVAPLMTRLVAADLSGAVSGHLKQRFRLPNRFRPSQLLFAASRDYAVNEAALVWASAALELNLLARLIQDDIADAHTMRWGLPSLRVIYGDVKAAQVVAILNQLTVLCAVEVDAAVGEVVGVRTPAFVADYARKTTIAMLEEIEWSHSGDSTLDLRSYESMAKRKVCSGQLTIQLLERVSSDDENWAQLMGGLSQLDLAACITNDVTEANLRRGLEEVRFAEGETRGEASEIQLRRPTIFNVILGTDKFLLSNSAADIAAMPDLSELPAREIFLFLRDVGAIRDAEERIEALEARALVSIPSGSSMHTLLARSVEPNSTEEEPNVGI